VAAAAPAGEAGSASNPGRRGRAFGGYCLFVAITAVLELWLPGGDHRARGWLSSAPGADAEILGS
jgi:hypothetical protein